MVPKHNLTRVSASGAVASAAARVFGILLMGGSAASSLKLTDDANGSGTAVINVKALTNDATFFDFTPFGGIAFATAVYATLAGAAAEAYVWWE